jgi:murein L,D-transpeptidase YcbB/YkuD
VARPPRAGSRWPRKRSRAKIAGVEGYGDARGLPSRRSSVQAFAGVTAACAEEPAARSLSSPDPVVAIIRAKLADPSLSNGANAADLAALEAFYRRRAGAPLWMTDMGLSAKGQHALFEIEKADDWGLDASAFELPPTDDLPASPEAEAIAEIKLDLAILKYARFARGGRVNPSEVSGLFDQAPLCATQTWSWPKLPRQTQQMLPVCRRGSANSNPTTSKW